MGLSQSSPTGTAGQAAGPTGNPAQALRDTAQTAAQALGNAPQVLRNTAAQLDATNAAFQNLSAAGADASAALKGVYRAAATGGARGYFGGAEDEDPLKGLAEYRLSVASATKDRIVRGLARALKNGGFNVDEGAGLEEIARELQKQLPNPADGRKRFVEDAEKQKTACTNIAKVLNDEFTPGAPPARQLIDTSLGAVSVCQQVAELVHSLSVGLHSEFLEVHRSVENTLSNLKVLNEVLDKSYDNILKNSTPKLGPGAEQAIENFREVYSRARAERDRQEAMLAGFLKTSLTPAQKELEVAMQGEKTANAVVRRLRLEPGSGEFAKSLAAALSGVGTVAAVSARVDRALREVGMRADDYVNAPSTLELRRAIDKLQASRLAGAPPEDLAKFLKASNTLLENFAARGDMKLGEGPVEGGRRSAQGGAPSIVDRRVRRHSAARKLIVQDFSRKTAAYYAALLSAVQALGPRLGRDVPLSDGLRDFRDALSRLNQGRLGTTNLDLALLGFYSDAAARERRDTFLADLDGIRRAVEKISALEAYRSAAGELGEIVAAVGGIRDAISTYGDALSRQSLGSVEDKGEVDADGLGAGGDDDEDGGLASIPEAARSAFDLEKAVNTFRYFYYIANVRKNLSQTQKELTYYGEKYDDVLGDAVAARLRQLAAERDARTASTQNLTNEEKALVEAEYKCKAEFYRAIQAVDLYLKEFTQKIAAHPDDVADIARMLDETTVIARWFLESTGDSLAQAFDEMPGWTGAAIFTGDKNIAAPANDNHYYNRVAMSNPLAPPAGGGAPAPLDRPVPGVPQMVADAATAAKAKAHVSTALDNFQALKNLMNAFVRIGDRFGGAALRGRVFMSPSQIYKALIEYVKCSAVSIGVPTFDPATNTITPPAMPAGAAPVAPQVQLAGPAGANVAADVIDAAVAADLYKRAYFGSVYAGSGLGGNFQIEDRYFTFVVKAMAAKILTVIGVSDLLERPGGVLDLTPTRMIIGGGAYDETPEAVPEAAELYFRLIRLAEFYKDLFAFDTAGADVQISMLPEIEGTFSGLIRLVFQRIEVGTTESGSYSDQEVRQIVREINAIHGKYRDRPDATGEVVSAFVTEMNRRYGLVKKDDWNKLQRFLREMRRTDNFGTPTQTNYSILPEEDDFDSKRRAPSDRFVGPDKAGAIDTEGRFKVDSTPAFTQWAMLSAFRRKLDEMFAQVSAEEFSSVSFLTIIRQGEAEMRAAKDPDDRFAVAARLIQGSGNLAGADVGKSFMFHETVVVGLNVLNAVHTILARARDVVAAADVARIRRVIVKYLTSDEGSNAANASVDAAAFYAALRDRVVANIPNSRDYILTTATPIRNRGNNITPGSTYADLYEQIRVAAGAGAGAGAPVNIDAELAKGFAHYIVNSDLAMIRLVEVATGLAVALPGLVQVRFPNTVSSQVQLDFSALRSRIEGLASDVRFFLDLLRPHMPKSVIERYEGSTETAGSLFWLESHLFDGLVRGAADDMALPEDQRKKTLEWMSRAFNAGYVDLIRSVPYDLAGAAGGATQIRTGVNPTVADAFGEVFSDLVFYNSARDGLDNFVTNGVDLGGAPGGILGLVSTRRPVAAAGAAAAPVFPVTAGGAAVDHLAAFWSPTGPINTNRSLLAEFNQVLAKYLATFYDQASGKIYRVLIDGFANGTASRAVMSPGASLPDLSTPAAGGGVVVFGRRGDPTPNGVLSQTLALILQRLVTDINPTTQVSDHLIATLSLVPLYIRESYRANLPTYAKLFTAIQQKGDIYKQILSQTTIQAGRPMLEGVKGAAAPALQASSIVDGGFAANIADRFVPTGGAVLTFQDTPTDNEGTKASITGIIDAISSGCYALTNSALEVLRELADEPLYLETQEQSIATYKDRNGKLPLMPLSSALTFLSGETGPAGVGAAATSEARLLPIHSLGDGAFRLMYGTRKLFGRPAEKFTLADAPGVGETLAGYNATAGSSDRVEEGRFGEYLHNVVSLLRFAVDARYLAGALAGQDFGGFLHGRLTQNAGGVDANIGLIDAGNGMNTVYALRAATTPQAVLATTESTYQNQELKKISDAVGSAGPTFLGQDRKKERTLNVFDLNIIPVNVHALQRGIPLAPTYNYAYTFEQFAAKTFGRTVGEIEDLNIDAAAANGVKNTRDMFLKLLFDPYAEIPLATYGNSTAIHDNGGANGLVVRIFRGDDSLMLGRPKFLSDQLFNKVLFGTLVDTNFEFDETGPPGAGRMASRASRGAPTINLRAHTTTGTGTAAVPPIWSAPAPAAGAAGTPFSRAIAAAAAVPGARAPRHAAVSIGVTPFNPGTPTAAITTHTPFGALTYIGRADQGADPNTALKIVSLGNNSVVKYQHLEAIGKARFDTRLVRNLVFISNVQRLLRLRLNLELTQYRNVLASGHGLTNLGITEYGAIPPSTVEPGRLPNYRPAFETATDRRYDNETRLI